MNERVTAVTQGNVSAAGRSKHRQIGVGGFRINDRAKQLVLEVLDSNRLNAGPMMARFEAEFASLHDRTYGLMCNSGTSALQIALAALKEREGWRDGDEVLVPAVTFVASANVVLYNGLKPIFVDVDPLYYTIDPALIEARVTPRTRAIMPVHIAGLPCDTEGVMAAARAHGLRIVEDSCEAMFVRDRGRPVGSLGDVGCFSTYAAHLISTGVGGIALTDDAEILELMKSAMNHGRDPVYTRMDDDAAAEGSALFRIANSRFSFVRLGHSFRCTEMEAALGIAQLEEREALLGRRREIAARLTAALAPLEDLLQLPGARPGTEHAYMMYPLVLRDDRVPRAALIEHLETDGVETRYLLPLINQPVYRSMFGDLDAEYPVAARLNARAFYVGCHPDMTDEDADHVAASLHAFLRRR